MFFNDIDKLFFVFNFVLDNMRINGFVELRLLTLKYHRPKEYFQYMDIIQY